MRAVDIDRFVSKPVKNFLFIILGNGIRWILSFFVTVYLARVLGASGFGKISFAFAIFAYGLLVSDLGLTILGTKEAAKRTNSIDDFASNILSLRLLLAIFTFIVLVVLSFSLPVDEDVRILLRIYSFSIFFYAFYLDWFFRGKERMANIAIASIVSQTVYTLLVFIFIKDAGGILRVPLLWILGIGSGMSFLLAVFFLTKHRLRFHIEFRLLKMSVPIGIAAIMNQVYFHFDLLTLGFMKTEIDVGLYNAAFKIVTFLLTIDTAFAWVYFPMVSRFSKKSKEKMKTLVNESAKFIAILVVPLAFGGTVLAGRVINVIYGARFLGASTALRILIWAIPLTSLQSIFAFGLLGCDREKKYSIGMVIGTLTNIVLNLILIPFLGIKGAAIATIVSEVVMLYVMARWFKEILFVPFYKFLLKPLLATIVMLIVIIILWKIATLPIIFISICVYIFTLLALKGISKNDLKLIRGEYGDIYRNS